MPHRTLLLPALFLAFAALSQALHAQTRVVVGYTAVPDFAAAFIAKERGYFARHGLDVELRQMTITSAIPAALLSDSIQVGGTTPPVLISAVDGGLELVGLATGALYNNRKTPPGIGLLARAGSGIAAPADLSGRRVGVPGLNGTLHVLLRHWLAAKGVDSTRLQFIEVPMPQIGDVLRGGSIDATIVPQPFLSRILGAGSAELLPGLAEELPADFATVVYAASASWVRAQPAAARAFRLAIADAVEHASRHRDDAYTDLAKYFKVPASALKQTQLPNFVADLKPAHLAFWAEAMKAQGMLKQPPQIDRLIAP